jgi:hypothetical protein
MRKKNGKNKERHSYQGEISTGGGAPETESSNKGGEPEKTSRKRLTVPERILAKASIARETIGAVQQMIAFHGAPTDLIAKTLAIHVDVASWLDVVRACVEGGWQPAVKGVMKDLNVGDQVAVAKDAADLYSYIPDGVVLAAGKIERSENGRIKRILLNDVRVFGEGCPEGQPSVFGWALVSHLERR